MLIIDALKKAHRKVYKDADYPETGSEDRLVRIDHVNDAIGEWEKTIKEGYMWTELKTTESVIFGGTGTDALPTNFLSFIHGFDAEGGSFVAVINFGAQIYTEVSPQEGQAYVRNNMAPNVFWREGSSIRTLPALTGTYDLPYMKKATRYENGDESEEFEMQDPTFIEDWLTAKMFLDNDDDTLYQVNMNQAQEKLQAMKYQVIA